MMYSQETINGISIEEFAAFLDGNLSNDDMRKVGDAIDANKEYSVIMSDVMEVNDSVEVYSTQQDTLSAEIPDVDYNLPELPISLSSQDTVDLVPVQSAEPVLTNVENNDISLIMASETQEIQDESSNSCCSEIHSLSSYEDCAMTAAQEETIDFNDFA